MKWLWVALLVGGTLACGVANAATDETQCVDVVLRGQIISARAEPTHLDTPGVALADALYTLRIRVDDVLSGTEKRDQITAITLADGLRAGPEELTFRLHRQRNSTYVWERDDHCP